MGKQMKKKNLVDKKDIKTQQGINYINIITFSPTHNYNNINYLIIKKFKSKIFKNLQFSKLIKKKKFKSKIFKKKKFKSKIFKKKQFSKLIKKKKFKSKIFKKKQISKLIKKK